MIPDTVQISQTQSINVYKIPASANTGDSEWISLIGSDQNDKEKQAIYINSDNGPLVQMQGFLHRLIDIGCWAIERKDLVEDDVSMGRLATYLVMLVNNNNLNFNLDDKEPENKK